MSSHSTLIFDAVEAWAEARAPGAGPSYERLAHALHHACQVAAQTNVDIPADRKDDIASNARDKLLRHFAKKAIEAGPESVAVKGTGVALVRLAVRQCWLDTCREEAPFVAGQAAGGDRAADVAIERKAAPSRDPDLARDIAVVLSKMNPAAAALLQTVDGGIMTIDELVTREVAHDPLRDVPGYRKRVRERIDMQVRRARLAFRALWVEHTGGATR